MKLVFQTLSYFDNVCIFLLHFLVLPIVQALFFLLMLQEASGSFASNTLMASLLLSSMLMAKSVISQYNVVSFSVKDSQLSIAICPYNRLHSLDKERLVY